MIRIAIALSLACIVAPLGAELPVKSYGQELVDQVIARNPGLLVVVFHAPAPDYPISASNIGRYGKAADEDDLRVIKTEKSNLEIAHGGARFEVELVLRDVAGTNIGALGLVFPYSTGADKKALEKKAIAIRDWLSTRILTGASLVEPYPFVASATTKTHAQKLVDAMLAKQKDLIVLAMHVTPPKAQDNIIIASNFGRIGKKADEDDLKVISSGQPRGGVYGEGKRYGVELPLRDAAGDTVGALSVGYRFKNGDDEKSLLAKAEKVRDELQKRIASLESLTELDP